MISREALKRLRKLRQKKYREQEGRFLVEGTNLVVEALRSECEAETLFLTESFLKNQAFREISRLAEKRDVPIQRLSAKDFEMLSETRAPQGVALLLKMPVRDFFSEELDNWNCAVVLDGVQDPGNVGTIIRTADWYGCSAVLLGEGCAELTNSKVLRATAGSAFHLPIFENVPLGPALARLKRAGFKLFAAEKQGALPHVQVKFTGRAALVVGNERRGISPKAKSAEPTTVWIPGRGRAESLNAAVAAGVLLDRLIFPGEPV